MDLMVPVHEGFSLLSHTRRDGDGLCVGYESTLTALEVAGVGCLVSSIIVTGKGVTETLCFLPGVRIRHTPGRPNELVSINEA